MSRRSRARRRLSDHAGLWPADTLAVSQRPQASATGRPRIRPVAARPATGVAEPHGRGRSPSCGGPGPGVEAPSTALRLARPCFDLSQCVRRRCGRARGPSSASGPVADQVGVGGVGRWAATRQSSWPEPVITVGASSSPKSHGVAARCGEAEGDRAGRLTSGALERVGDRAPGEAGDVPEPVGRVELHAEAVGDVAGVDPRLGEAGGGRGCGRRAGRRPTGARSPGSWREEARAEVGARPLPARVDLGRRPAALVRPP